MPNARLLAALDEHPRAHRSRSFTGTSTGSEHPLAELGAEMRGSRTLLMADCVTTLGGVELDFDRWGIDYAYSCTQKCLGAPPGMSPIAVPIARSSGVAGGERLSRCRSTSSCCRTIGWSARRPTITPPRSCTSMLSTRCCDRS